MCRSPFTLRLLSTCRSVTKTDNCHEPSPYITFPEWVASTIPLMFLVMLVTVLLLVTKTTLCPPCHSEPCPMHSPPSLRHKNSGWIDN